MQAPRVVYSAPEIAHRIHELGGIIDRAYPQGDLVLLGVLKGSFMFLADLARAIRRPTQIEFIQASSYGAGTESSGTVNLSGLPTRESLGGKHVLVIEDIVDGGNTLKRLNSVLASHLTASLEVCTLLHKRKVATETRFTGFSCPDYFLVGYGLDYAGAYRHLPYIGRLPS